MFMFTCIYVIVAFILDTVPVVIGSVVGVVVAIAAVLGIIGFVAFYVMKKKGRSKK